MLAGLMCARNESWVIGLSARVALMWCDHLIVLVHSCTDDTMKLVWDIRMENPGRVTIMQDARQTWHEMQMRQHMLLAARKIGATHIAMVDADEIMTGNIVERMKAYRPATANMLSLPGYNLRGGLHRYHANGIWANRWFSTEFQDDPMLSWDGDKFHSREPKGRHMGQVRFCQQGEGGIMHLWGASERRLHAKQRLYKITERLRWPDKSVAEINEMYGWAMRGTGKLGDSPETWQFKDVPASWWAPYAHLMHHLKVDGPVWQEAECERLISEAQQGHLAGLEI